MSLVRRSRTSALMTKEACEKPTKAEVKSFGQKAGIYSLGLGIGTSLGFAVNELVLPKILKQLGPKERALFAGGIGVSAALASAAGTKRVLEGNRGGKRR